MANEAGRGLRRHRIGLLLACQARGYGIMWHQRTARAAAGLIVSGSPLADLVEVGVCESDLSLLD